MSLALEPMAKNESSVKCCTQLCTFVQFPIPHSHLFLLSHSPSPQKTRSEIRISWDHRQKIQHGEAVVVHCKYNKIKSLFKKSENKSLERVHERHSFVLVVRQLNLLCLYCIKWEDLFKRIWTKIQSNLDMICQVLSSIRFQRGHALT